MDKYLTLIVLAALAMLGSFAAGHYTGVAVVRGEWEKANLAAAAKADVVEEKQQAAIDVARVEYRYKEKRVVEYVPITEKEMIRETVNLNSCALDDGDVRVLNDATQRFYTGASQDSN